MKSLVILISGRGSNMIRISQACRDDAWPAQIACVISNRPGVAGLSSATELGLRTECIDHKSYANRDAFDQALGDRIEQYAPDLVVLAGFMRILGHDFVERFAGRLINIHPSLLPSFSGLNTHARALQAGVKLHGATVHYVIPELDAGPIIGQAAVPVLPDDDAQSLQTRVHQAEHQLYPQSIRWLIENQVMMSDSGTATRLNPAAGVASLWIAESDVGD